MIQDCAVNQKKRGLSDSNKTPRLRSQALGHSDISQGSAIYLACARQVL
jgi:hypothetical protein